MKLAKLGGLPPLREPLPDCIVAAGLVVLGHLETMKLPIASHLWACNRQFPGGLLARLLDYWLDWPDWLYW